MMENTCKTSISVSIFITEAIDRYSLTSLIFPPHRPSHRADTWGLLPYNVKHFRLDSPSSNTGIKLRRLSLTNDDTFAMADKFPALGPSTNQTCSATTEERRHGTWETPWKSLACQNLRLFSPSSTCSFLPSEVITDSFLTLLSDDTQAHER